MIPRFLTGLAVGYVLGTRAGRERYEQLAESWQTLLDSDLMQQVRAEFAQVTGATEASAQPAAASLAPPIIVGPPPAAGTATPAGADALLPDLESSTAASVNGDMPPAPPPETATRLDPPSAS